jgi:hypothetical protein
MGPVLVLSLIRHKMCSFASIVCVMSPTAGTGAGGLHVELCVPMPNENHRAYSTSTKTDASKTKLLVALTTSVADPDDFLPGSDLDFDINRLLLTFPCLFF